MSIAEIIATLRDKGIELSVVDDNLRVLGNKRALSDAALVEVLRQNKSALIAAIARGDYASPATASSTTPANRIPLGCTDITPAMLPLIELNEAEIASIVSSVPGGAANVQDIYPLGPLQEGILFHHLMQGDGDVYLLPRLSAIASRERLRQYVAALQAAIDRHDILRTAFLWDGLPEPVQVVWRQAPLVVEELQLDPAAGDIAAHMEYRFHPLRYRLDVRQAPAWRLFIAHDPLNDRWIVADLMHHLLSDHTTGALLYAEIETHLLGESAQLAPPQPFRNFIAQTRRGVSRAAHEAFFTNLLREVDEPTLPFGLADAQGNGGTLREAHQEVDAALSQRLRAVARLLGVSVASICHVVWAMVLARVAGRDDVVFGTLLFGRMRAGEGAEQALGMFINTLPVRIKVAESGARASVRQAHALLSQLIEHEHAPLALAQRCSAVQSPTPLFTAHLNYRYEGAPIRSAEAVARSARAWDGIEVLKLEERTNYPLGLAVNDLESGFSFELQVDQAIDPQPVFALVQTALAALVTALERDDATPIRDLEVVPTAQREALLALGDGGPSISESPAAWPAGGLYGRIAAQARRSPQATAVVEGCAELSYQQLIDRADRVAQQLRALGLGAESRVAILADRSSESIVAVLGILAAGAAYVPLDPAHPDERLAFVLDDAAIAALVAPGTLRARAGQLAALRPLLADRQLIVADLPVRDDALFEVGQPEAATVAAVRPEHAAYVIYTSGSTGMPKGVVIEQGSAMNLVDGFIARHDFPGQRLLMIPPLLFDASVGDVLPALAVGAALVLHPAPNELYASELQRFCQLHRVTAIDAPAALWRRWTEGFAAGFVDPVLPAVRLLMFGGEGVPLEQVRRFAALTQNRIVLSNHYGPTEATVCATMLTTRDGQELSGLELPIGTPLPGVRVYVLDAQHRLVPQGVEGELFIGGAGVAREYLGAPALTAERFVADPFAVRAADLYSSGAADMNSSSAQPRMYATGDLVRWNADGNLQFLGRRDHQVKIRGFRIELGEIEVCLAAHPGVREAVVLAREASSEAGGGKRLVAYVTARDATPGEALHAEALRHYLAAQLPEHMVPAAYVVLAQLPLTPNGKLDRKALPVPDAAAYATQVYEAPVGAVEQALAGIWADVLKLPRVGRHDNFFELGGHSLLAITMIERMRRADLPIDVRALFAAPTLKMLAETVRGESRDSAVPANLIPLNCAALTPAMLPLVTVNEAQLNAIVAAVPGGAANVQDIYPLLSPLQAEMLRYHQTHAQGDAYLGVGVLSFASREHLDRYAQAMQAAVDRHDILRTAFVWEGLVEPLQVVLRQVQLPIHEVVLDPADGDILTQLRARFDPRQFRLDVRQAPLWQLFIAEDAPNQRWVMLELVHYLIDDNTSFWLLMDEIKAHLLGQADRLPAPQPYRNFVFQARHGANVPAQAALFRDMLGDVRELTAPFGCTALQGDNDRIVEARQDLSPQLSHGLRGAARSAGVSVASLIHLAWAMVLARVSGCDDVVFGTLMFGRMQGDHGADRALGMFINLLPLRVQLADHPVRVCLRETHDRLSQLMRHEHAALSLAQQCSGISESSPLFVAVLNYRHAGADVSSAEAAAEAARAWAGIERLDWQERTIYPVNLLVDDHADGFSMTAQVDATLDPQQLCALMQTALESLVGELTDTAAEGSARAAGAAIKCRELLAEETGS